MDSAPFSVLLLCVQCRSVPGLAAARNAHAIADAIVIAAETAASSRARSKACVFSGLLAQCFSVLASSPWMNNPRSEDSQKPARQDVAEKLEEIEDAAMEGKEERTAHDTYRNLG